MKIKKYMFLWMALGCLTLNAVGCQNVVCSLETTAAATKEAESSREETEPAEAPAEAETIAETSEKIVYETNAPELETLEASKESLFDHAVSEAILTQNAEWFTGEECQAEGHIILSVEETDDILTVYALTMYGEYAFQNVDYFIKSAGTGVIPAVLTFDLRISSNNGFRSMELPEDGSGYTESVKRMFPEYLWDRVLSIQEEDRAALTEMERSYAERYLEAMGRDAVIGDYADVGHTYLTDHGISVEVSNKMLEYEKNMGPYPGWHGTTETIEDGVRYLYSVFVDEEVNQIIYEKRVFDTLETVEKFVYDAETGEEIEICGYPKKE